MTIEEHINHWIKSADYDLKVAESLFANKHNMYCLYLGHLALEKLLKAKYVKDNSVTVPPKVHDLLKLANKTKLPLSDEQKEFLFLVNRFNIEAKYPDYKNSFYKTCTTEFTAENFLKIKEYAEWIKLQI